MALGVFSAFVFLWSIKENYDVSRSSRQEVEAVRGEFEQGVSRLDQVQGEIYDETEGSIAWAQDRVKRRLESYEETKNQTEKYEASALLVKNEIETYSRQEAVLREEIQDLTEGLEELKRRLNEPGIKRKERKRARKESKSTSTGIRIHKLKLDYTFSKRTEAQEREARLSLRIEELHRELRKLEAGLAPLESARSGVEEVRSGFDKGTQTGSRNERSREPGPSVPSSDDANVMRPISNVSCCRGRKIGKLIVSADGVSFISDDYKRHFRQNVIRAIKLKKKKIIIYNKDGSTFRIANVPVPKLEDFLENELGWYIER